MEMKIELQHIKVYVQLNLVGNIFSKKKKKTAISPKQYPLKTAKESLNNIIYLNLYYGVYT